MIVTKKYLERRVADTNEWLQNNLENHWQRASKKQRKNYYIAKLSEMDELNLKTIEI